MDNVSDIKKRNENILKALEIHKQVDSDKYHLSTTVNEDGIRWALYKKYKDWDTYISEDNGPILTSDNSTLENLIQYLKTHDGYLDKDFRNKFRSLESEVIERADKKQKEFNTSDIGKRARTYYLLSQSLLLAVMIVELISGIIRFDLTLILLSIQLYITYLITTKLKKITQTYQKEIFEKEAEADIYKEAFKEEWKERIRERDERVRG